MQQRYFFPPRPPRPKHGRGLELSPEAPIDLMMGADSTRRAGVHGRQGSAREANEQVRQLALETGTKRQLLALFCECGQEDCRYPIAASPDEYEAIRSDLTHRLVAVGHS